jgi:S-adenosylmethionine:tRNA ribosyltransferase-isomerase
MKKTPISKFDFNLPTELIAQFPVEKRDESRLLYLKKETKEVFDYRFKDILDLISEEDFFVINNTKVLKARLFGKKATGKTIEILLVEDLGDNIFCAMLKGRVKIGDKIYINNYTAELIDIKGDLRVLRFDEEPYIIMEKCGHIPLPPYIKREDKKEDHLRYQTIYSKVSGSVAAPTAGLHFTDELLGKLKEKIEVVEITLNVGIGTFKPVKCDFVEDHKMHSENFFISRESFERINYLKAKKKNLVAVGTTTVRALESASSPDGKLEKFGNNKTDIFIYPGYKLKVVDKMITNFHLPKSTLLMLVSAFVEDKLKVEYGTNFVLDVYKRAVEKRYRFFSYGDAMFIG